MISRDLSARTSIGMVGFGLLLLFSALSFYAVETGLRFSC